MSAQKDLLTKVADARPRRLDPEHRGDPAAIMTRSTAVTVAHRPVRRRLLIGLVPTAAVVTAGAVVAANVLGTGEKGPVVATDASAATDATAARAPETARELFLVAAERTEQEGATTGRYWVVDTEYGESTEVGPATRRYHVMRRGEVQRWLPTRPGDSMVEFFRSAGAAPITADDEAAWRADGAPARWTLPAPAGAPAVVVEAAPAATFVAPRFGPTGRAVVFAGGEVSAAELATLPTDPAALRQWIVNRRGTDTGEQLTDYSLFILGQQVVSDLQVSPRVRAAAYRMMADLKGTQVLGPATDQRGRGGIAVAFFRKGDGGSWAQVRLVIDPRTGQALTDESWTYGRGAAPAPTGTLLSYSLRLSGRYSDDNPKAP
jgi:hypothetical protein